MSYFNSKSLSRPSSPPISSSSNNALQLKKEGGGNGGIVFTTYTALLAGISFILVTVGKKINKTENDFKKTISEKDDFINKLNNSINKINKEISNIKSSKEETTIQKCNCENDIKIIQDEIKAIRENLVFLSEEIKKQNILPPPFL